MKQLVIINVLNVIEILLFLWTSLSAPTYFLYDYRIIQNSPWLALKENMAESPERTEQV